MIAIINKIVSGGQTGVDRAALDAAIDNNVDYGGWCPKGGWAEDYQYPPGLLQKYPKMKETPSPESSQRTEWNVRDSSATLILTGDDSLQVSRGTELSHRIAILLEKPLLTVNIYQDNAPFLISEWMTSLGDGMMLNIAGPRESEYSGIYSVARKIITEVVIRF